MHTPIHKQFSMLVAGLVTLDIAALYGRRRRRAIYCCPTLSPAVITFSEYMPIYGEGGIPAAQWTSYNISGAQDCKTYTAAEWEAAPDP